MNKLKAELINTYKSINVISREALKFGIILSFTLLISAAVIYFKFKCEYNNWRMIGFAREMVESAFGCFVSAEISALIAEYMYRQQAK